MKFDRDRILTCLDMLYCIAFGRGLTIATVLWEEVFCISRGQSITSEAKIVRVSTSHHHSRWP